MFLGEASRRRAGGSEAAGRARRVRRRGRHAHLGALGDAVVEAEDEVLEDALALGRLEQRDRDVALAGTLDEGGIPMPLAPGARLAADGRRARIEALDELVM